MTKQARGGNRNGRRRDPNQDVQPWLGWVAALLVVVIVVVAVAMGMERTGNQRNAEAEVRMTPLVGGMALPATTETASGEPEVAEVTPLPAAVTDTTTISDSVAMSGTEMMTGTVEMTSTDALSESVLVTASNNVTNTAEVTVTDGVSVTDEVTVTVDVTSETDAAVEATGEVTAGATITEEVTPSPTEPPAPRPTATPQPTATPIVNPPVFAEGDVVVASAERVPVYADATLDATVLDSYRAGVEFQVLPPGGDYSSYPVEVDGHGWARIRAADGLVGWVMTDQLEAQ